MDMSLSPILVNCQGVLNGDLLPNLPDGPLTQDVKGFNHNALRPGAGEREASTAYVKARNPNQAGYVISKIEDIFESIADSILNQKQELVIHLRNRRKPGPQNSATQVRPIKTYEVRFPSRSPQEAWKFTVLLRILELSHEALVTGIVTTKRDIYYRDPELFMKQAVVDRYVGDLAYTLGVERDALNVVAAAKGLVAGSFTLKRKDDSMVDYSSEPEGTLLPNTKEIQSFQFHDVSWILVIEKEATFRTLACTQYWKTSLAGKGIIITAKGYPDIQTRQFLHILTTCHLNIPTFCLVDFDPDGIGIMSTYKYGSMALSHEDQNLTVPSMGWLGVQSADIIPTIHSKKVGLLKLSGRDRRTASRLIDREALREGAGVEWRRELQVMLMLNCKAEIQILSSGDPGLEGWLDRKLMGTLGDRLT